MLRYKTLLAPTSLAIILISGSALAAITLSYTTPSSQSLGLTAAPVVFVAGGDAANSKYVDSFALSTNATRFSVTVKGVPEATVTIDELFKVKNQDSAAHTVTLSTPQVVNANVLVYKLDIYNGVTLVSTLDFLAGSPSANLGSMAAAAEYHAKLTVQLASGAGANNVNEVRNLSISVSA